MNRRAYVVAIVPAAGRSGRMGTLKQLLPVDGLPMVMHVVETLRAGGADEVIIVANAALSGDLVDPLRDVRVVVNDNPDTEMIDSIRIALAASDEASADGFLICPCDAAGITAADVRRCIETFTDAPDVIIIATHHYKRGHPIIFPASLAAAVRSSECDGGLNHLARNRPNLVRTVECDSPGTIANVNTPADYEKLK
jgi:molybdenum cofactor cytidylyltransferase